MYVHCHEAIVRLGFHSEKYIRIVSPPTMVKQTWKVMGFLKWWVKVLKLNCILNDKEDDQLDMYRIEMNIKSMCVNVYVCFNILNSWVNLNLQEKLDKIIK